MLMFCNSAQKLSTIVSFGSLFNHPDAITLAVMAVNGLIQLLNLNFGT
jgi:hypothetical protein